MVLTGNDTYPGTHTFDMSTTDFDGNTFAGNTFKLSITEDGEHASGVPYTTGVTYTADLVTIEVDDSTPSPLYYYSVENSGYGGKILIDHAGLGVADGSDSGGYAEATYFHIEVLPDAEGDVSKTNIPLRVCQRRNCVRTVRFLSGLRTPSHSRQTVRFLGGLQTPPRYL